MNPARLPTARRAAGQHRGGRAATDSGPSFVEAEAGAKTPPVAPIGYDLRQRKFNGKATTSPATLDTRWYRCFSLGKPRPYLPDQDPLLPTLRDTATMVALRQK